ncbi:MAG: hypothetical protein GY696_02750 [Gammaproteobacteria bacterium]|nr:hypothetical protein [Gammaproteobacteria bacterium]
MTLIAAQRTAIQEGLSYDTCMYGLNSTIPYHQDSQGYHGSPKTEAANAYSVQPVRAYASWAAPEPSRPQNQWEAQAPARFQIQNCELPPMFVDPCAEMKASPHPQGGKGMCPPPSLPPEGGSGCKGGGEEAQGNLKSIQAKIRKRGGV